MSEANQRREFGPPRPAVPYLIAVYVIPELLRAFCRGHYDGGQCIPDSGPAVLMANHESYLDPLMIGRLTARPILYGAKEELFGGFGSWLFPRLNCIPVHRGTADMALFRKVAARLEAGRLVCLFPEGTRSTDGLLRRAQPGAVAMALRSGAPIVPIGIHGTMSVIGPSRRLHPGAVGIEAGPPLHFGPLPRSSRLAKAVVEQAGERVMTEIARLRTRVRERVEGV